MQNTKDGKRYSILDHTHANEQAMAQCHKTGRNEKQKLRSSWLTFHELAFWYHPRWPPSDLPPSRLLVQRLHLSDWFAELCLSTNTVHARERLVHLLTDWRLSTCELKWYFTNSSKPTFSLHRLHIQRARKTFNIAIKLMYVNR